jgi:hypothetical protein
VICKGVLSIDQSAFESCYNLSSISIPSSVSSIGDSAFSGCTSLIKIQSNATVIGSFAFAGCASLDVDASSFGTLTSIGSYAFRGCASLTADGVSALTVDSAYTKGYDTNGATIYKTDSTTAYADGCLYVGDISGLTSIPLQNTATSIGSSAFSGCVSLTKVAFTSLTSTYIGTEAFNGCVNLIYIDFGSITTASIGDFAFFRCDQPTGTIAATTHAGAVTIRAAIAAKKSNFAN